MPSVLIVDDEPDIRFLLRRMAEQAQWYVAGEAASGQEALDSYRDLKPDVIVLDYRMPGLSGLETAERILAEHPRQAIVLFTAFGDPGLERAADALNVRACLPKSELHRLLDVLRDSIG